MRFFLAFVAFILVTFTACASAPAVVKPPPEPMRWLELPVEVRVSTDFDACQIAAIEAGMLYLESRAQRELFTPHSVPPTDPAVLGIPVERVISMAPAPHGLSDPSTLGEAHRDLYPGTRILYYANVEMTGCSPWVAGHELGHALGLDHSSGEGALMFWINSGGWALSEAELAHLRSMPAAGSY